MPFPVTSVVVDDFNRASLGADWTTTASTGMTTVTSTVFVSSGGGGALCESRYEHDFGPNVHAYLTYSAVGAADWQMTLFSNSTGHGYFLYYQASGTQTQLHIWTGADTQIGVNTGITWGAGDKIGMQVEAGNIAVWRQPNAGSWGPVVSARELTYTNMTDIRFRFGTFGNNSLQWDDLVVANASSTTLNWIGAAG